MGIGLKTSTIFAGAVLAFGLASPSFAATRQMEKLSRGLAVANTGKGMLIATERKLRPSVRLLARTTWMRTARRLPSIRSLPW